jgi:DNA-binding transcriptional ArsR family regulator
MSDPRVTVLKALAHPLRLRVVDRLGHRGPAPVSQLAVELGASLPGLSAGLRQLREAGIVVVERQGRQAVYALAPGGVDRLLPLLDRIAGAHPAPLPARPSVSRTCYDHLAGPLGVSLYRGLLARGALVAAADGTVSVARPEPLAALGVDVTAIVPGRRRLAFECLDASEHAAHLAGALGDAVAAALLAREWVLRAGAEREVRLTPAGVDGLERTLAVRVLAGASRRPPTWA